MRRPVAPLLLALTIVSPPVAQPAAASGPTTRYSRLVGKKVFEEIVARSPAAR